MTWDSIAISKAIRKTAAGANNQILSSEIMSVGKFPVIDQGQSFIAGYSDLEDRVIRDDLPLVIFGDHTRAVKFVDFPFILGADGTKVLKPREELFDVKFFSLALQSLEIPSRGYNRHFSVLKERSIPRPELPEQRKIARVLGLIQDAIAQQERLIHLSSELKKSLIEKLITEGLRAEMQKETEIGRVPASWKLVKFGDAVSIKNGQVNPTRSPFDALLHVGPENIESDTGRLIDLRTNKEQQISSGNYHFTAEDILYSKIRPYLNKVAIPDFEGTCSADMYPIRSKGDQFVRSFLFQLLLSERFKRQAVSFQDRTGIPKINRVQLSSIVLPRPDIAEQHSIADAVATADEQVNQLHKKRTILCDLFRTLLHQLMTAQIRVHSLDLNELESAAAA